jgi:hypothetical protein
MTALMLGEVNVTFTKVSDGSSREMRCTRNIDQIELTQEIQPTESTRAVNEDVLVVYDLDIEAFRSFRLDSVTAFTAK